MVRVIGNNHHRKFLYYSEVPSIVMKQEFRHLDEERKSWGFIHYRGKWFHLSDFARHYGGLPLNGRLWDGHAYLNVRETVLVKLGTDGCSYTIATMTR